MVSDQMSVQAEIDAMEALLRDDHREQTVRTQLTTALRRVNKTFAAHPESVSADQHAALQVVSLKTKTILRFERLADRLQDVDDTDECVALARELDDIATTLSGTAVLLRVQRERRRLVEVQPTLTPGSGRQASAQRAAILKLELGARPCSKGHPMAIRSGENGYFWGCSAYPQHSVKWNLSADELNTIVRAGR